MSKRLFKTMAAVLAIAAAATGPARAQWTGGTYTATATENLGAITVNGNATLTINSDVTVTVTGGINAASWHFGYTANLKMNKTMKSK